MGWDSSQWDSTFDTFVSLEQLWGPSTWRPVGEIDGIPVPHAGTAEATVTFNELGCNLLRMSYSLDGERYAYVTVEQAEQVPAAPQEPTVTVNRKTATSSWDPVDSAEGYAVTIEGLAPVKTTGAEIDIDLSSIANGKTKSFPALITAANAAGTSEATESVVSLKGSSGDGPGHGNGNSKPDKPGKPNKQEVDFADPARVAFAGGPSVLRFRAPGLRLRKPGNLPSSGRQAGRAR